MPITLKDVAAYANEQDDQIAANAVPIGRGGTAKEITPRMLEIVKILQADPILAEPCLNWLQETQARIAAAKLATLYTPEQIAELRQKHGLN